MNMLNMCCIVDSCCLDRVSGAVSRDIPKTVAAVHDTGRDVLETVNTSLVMPSYGNIHKQHFVSRSIA